MDASEQLEEWVKGNSIHNGETDECCPDFSCCIAKIKTDPETRKRFQKAYTDGDDQLVHEMLGMFLAGAFADKSVYIAGGSVIGKADGNIRRTRVW